MEIVTNGDAVPPALRGAVAALGNFDGFHGGHQAVVGAAARLAAAHSLPLAALTFDPHPAMLFKPAAPPFAIATLEQKLEHLREFGVDLAIVLPFTPALAAISAKDFVKNILVNEFGLKGVTSGYDFTFGHNRAGTVETLRTLGATQAMAVEIVQPVMAAGASLATSSSLIRKKLHAGSPRDAARLMGRWWRIQGVVAHGEKRGRTIGFPTANIELGAYVRPQFGVYAVRVLGAADRIYEGVANIGVRPTMHGSIERLEVHVHDFEGDLYGKTLDIEIVEFIRAEQRFSGLDALKAQIAVDCATAQKILRQPAYGITQMKSKTRTDFTERLVHVQRVV
jgi:riboflavin kinase / FMN adenylyltransferase